MELRFTKSAAVGATSGSAGRVDEVGGLVVVDGPGGDAVPWEPPHATNRVASTAVVSATHPYARLGLMTGIRRSARCGSFALSIEPVPLPRRDRLEWTG